MTAHSATMVSGGSPWSEKFQELLINWGGGGERGHRWHMSMLWRPHRAFPTLPLLCLYFIPTILAKARPRAMSAAHTSRALLVAELPSLGWQYLLSRAQGRLLTYGWHWEVWEARNPGTIPITNSFLQGALGRESLTREPGLATP